MAKERKRGFEEALKRLEELVALMEDENISLEKALEHYEEGVRLARFCTRALDAAERRIEILNRQADGQAVAEPFSPEGKEENARRKRSPRTDEEGLLFSD